MCSSCPHPDHEGPCPFSMASKCSCPGTPGTRGSVKELEHRVGLMEAALRQIALRGCKYRGNGCVDGHPSPCVPCLARMALEATSPADKTVPASDEPIAEPVVPAVPKIEHFANAGTAALGVCVGETLDHALDVALSIVWLVGRAVHGTATAAKDNPAFLRVHEDVVAVRAIMHQRAAELGGQTLLMQSKVPIPKTEAGWATQLSRITHAWAAFRVYHAPTCLLSTCTCGVSGLAKNVTDAIAGDHPVGPYTVVQQEQLPSQWATRAVRVTAPTRDLRLWKFFCDEFEIKVIRSSPWGRGESLVVLELPVLAAPESHVTMRWIDPPAGYDPQYRYCFGDVGELPEADS